MPTLIPLLKEVLFDKSAIQGWLGRNKLTAMLLISHIVFFWFLLFMSEQTIQKENELVSLRRDTAVNKETVSHLAQCQTDLSLVQADYRQLHSQTPTCSKVTASTSTPSPPPPRKPPRPAMHPPRRMVPDKDVDYQHVLDGV